MEWYCIRTAPRQEGRVAARLRIEDGLEVFSPRIRFRRSRMGQRIWATEALFPGYVFARFNYFEQHRKLRAIPGVSSVLMFGDQPATLADDVVAALRSAIGCDEEVLQLDTTAEPMSEVMIVEGPLRGLQLLVTRVMPARQRLAVLLEILGMQREVEVSAAATVPVQPRAPALLSSLRQDL
jgi:transcriptional antiterminator RfaH